MFRIYHQIIEAINQRSIQERYIEASVITAYLHNPLAKLEKKGVVKAFCLRLLSRLDKNEVVERNTVDEIDTIISNTDLEVNDTETLPLPMKLQLTIEASLKIPKGVLPSDESLSSSLKYELNIAEQTGRRGNLLEKVYQMLLTVPPTSVESEKVFSSCSYLCNKFRSSLSDKSLNILCLIRHNEK